MKCVLLTLLSFSTFIFTSAFAYTTEQSGKSVFSFEATEIENFQIAGGKDNPNKYKDKAKKAKKENNELADDIDEVKNDKAKKAKKEKDKVEDEITEDNDKLKGIEK